MTKAGKWSDPDIPGSGWQFVKMRDLQPNRKKCEMHCGANIRFVHLMRHPTTGLKMEVGRCCAGNMEGNEAAAEARQKTMEAAARRVSKRAKTLAQNREAFACIDVEPEGYHHLVGDIIPALDRLHVEAQRHAKEAVRDDADFDSGYFFDEALDHQQFVDAVKIALDRARARIPDLLPLKAGEDLIAELRNASDVVIIEGTPISSPWRRTKKGYRFETSQRDVAQVYRRGGVWWGLIMPAGTENPTYHGKLDADLSKAMRKCINALGHALRKAGRLPRR